MLVIHGINLKFDLSVTRKPGYLNFQRKQVPHSTLSNTNSAAFHTMLKEMNNPQCKIKVQSNTEQKPHKRLATLLMAKGLTCFIFYFFPLLTHKYRR